MTKPLSNLGGGTFKGTIKVKTLTETHSEQKFGASLATWYCPATLKSPRTKISTYDKTVVKFGRRYFKDRRKRPGDSQASFFLWLTLPAKTLKDHWPISIAPQHSKVPVPKYPPMTKPLSNLGGGTFKGTIKVKTLTETHSEQKFEASLATWHCPPTLKSPCTKISTYDKSLVKFGSRYLKDRRKRPGVSQASLFFWLFLLARTLEDNWPISIAY